MARWLRILPVSFVVLACTKPPAAAPPAEPVRRVFNGDDASNSFPRVVRIGNCSGTYVCPNVILTANHCSSRLVAGASVTDSASPGSDILLVRLDTAIAEFTRIPVGGSVPTGDAVQIVGFGETYSGGGAGKKTTGMMVVQDGNSDPLIFVPSPLYNHQSSCPGDSGGPALAGGNLVGVCSSVKYRGNDPSLACGNVIEARYIPTETHRTWIDGKLDEWCSPVVEIEAVDPSAVEPDEGGNPSDSASYRLRRHGSTESRLEVTLKAPRGTATEGSDFAYLPRTVVLEPGESTVPIIVDPLHDFEIEPNPESVLEAIEPTRRYAITQGKAEATVYISNLSIPTIDLSVSPGVVAEGEQASLTLTRSGGDLSASLRVRLQIVAKNPEAVYGRDTDQFALALTFEANQATVSTVIKALADEEDSEPTEFIGLRIRESDASPFSYLTRPATREGELAIQNNPDAEPEPAATASPDPFAAVSPPPASTAPAFTTAPIFTVSPPPAAPTIAPFVGIDLIRGRITEPAIKKGLPLPR